MMDSVDTDSTFILDTGVLIACGSPENEKFVALSEFAKRNRVCFVVPQRVHDELSSISEKDSSLYKALEEGWATVFSELDYSKSSVSKSMDSMREYIAQRSNRSEDSVEKADTALAGVAAHLLDENEAENVIILTTDKAAGEAAEIALSHEGYEDRAEYIDGFRFIDQI